MTLAAAAASGSRLESLKALRDVLAGAIDDTDSGRDVAALSRQFTDVLSQIEAAERESAPVKGTPLDELANRRSGRTSGSGGRARPASG